MTSLKQPHEDGITRIERLEPGHVDIVLDTHPNRLMLVRPAAPRACGLTLLCAVLAVFSLCLLVSQFRRHADELLPPAAKPAKTADTVPAQARTETPLKAALQD